jgi:RNA polymerase sigma factor (TIGR02999 family)
MVGVAAEVVVMADVTLLLSKIEDGDSKACEELLPLVYDELHRLAASKMVRESSDHTLQATAVVHEAYLRLFSGRYKIKCNSRRHFFAVAGEAMRRILVESARRKKRLKHGGEFKRQVLTDVADFTLPAPADEIIAVGEALSRLELEDPEIAKLVKLRFFGGFTMSQIADALDKPVRTVQREWTYARAWLHRELATDEDQ